MKPRISTRIAAVALLVVLAFPVGLAAQDNHDLKRHKHVRYSLKVLPTLGGTFSHADGINNSGSVAGLSTLTGDMQADAFLWHKGVTTDLGTLGGPLSVPAEFGHSINSRGTVAGFSNTSTPDPNGEDVCGSGTFLICLPFVWQKGVMTALPLLGGNNGQVGGINSRGEIVGFSETPTQDSCSIVFLQVQATLWENGQVQELPPLPGDPDGAASDINDNGQVAGVTGCVSTNTFHAVLWPKGPNGPVIDLGNLGGSSANIPSSINNRGQVVGQSDLPGDTTHHAFLWTKEGGMHDLGTLNDQPVSLAFSINNQTQIVGIFEDFTGDNTTGFLWQHGVMTDLNTLIPPGSPLFIKEPLGINDRSEIVGFGLDSNGNERAFLLTPCDEHHPGIKDCDYGMADVPDAVRVSPMPRTPHSAASTPGSVRMGMLNRFRFSRSQRNPVPGAGPATDQEQQASANNLKGDLLDDHTLAPPCWPPFRCQHRGVCDVDSTGRLTGYCRAHIPPFNFCDLKLANQCPKGKKALKPTFVQCGQGFPSLVDEDRPCTF